MPHLTTVIIPTRDPGRGIERLFSALKGQSIRSEILLMDSSESSVVRDLAGPLGARVVPVSKGEFDHGGTRTAAALKAGGELLIFLTQDVLPADVRTIERIVEPFGDERVGAAYGRQLPLQGAGLFAAHLRLFNYPQESCLRSIEDRRKYGIKTPFLSNSFSAYRKSALMEIGGFRPKLIMGEDVCAGGRLLIAGYRIAYVADSAVYHSHNYSLLQEFRRYFDIGVFHDTERWLLEEFGNAEGEGGRYIASEIRFILSRRKYHLLPESFARNFLKYAGYRLGRVHDKIPAAIAKKMSMHRRDG